METKEYIITEGTHGSGFHPNIFGYMDELKYEVRFTRSCIYKFEDDKSNKEVNRLFGLNFGLHHLWNSVWFGWNVDKDNPHQLAIYAVSYKRGKKNTRKIATVLIHKTYVFDIMVTEACYTLRINDQKGGLVGWANIQKPKTVSWGYRLFPRFGGSRVAPQKIIIFLKQLFG